MYVGSFKKHQRDETFHDIASTKKTNVASITQLTHYLSDFTFTLFRTLRMIASEFASRANNEPPVSRFIGDCPYDCRDVNSRRVTGRHGVTRNAIRVSYNTNIHCYPARDAPSTDHMSRCRDYAVNIAIADMSPAGGAEKSGADSRAREGIDREKCIHVFSNNTRLTNDVECFKQKYTYMLVKNENIKKKIHICILRSIFYTRYYFS